MAADRHPLFQLLASTSLRNTAFQDEALYLYAGRLILTSLMGGPPVPEAYGTWFSGHPYLYPVLGGALDIAGGLFLARVFSLGCMLFATCAVYLLAARVVDRNSAAISAALFSFQGSVLFLGWLATFDAMSLALLALASVLAVCTSGRRWVLPAVLVGPILLLAIVAKYAALLFAPTVLALLLLNAWRVAGPRQALLRLAVALLVLAAVAVPLLLLFYVATPEVLAGLRVTTTARDPIFQAPRAALAIQAAKEGGLLVLLGLIGALLVARERAWIALVLLGTALLAPAYHVYKMETVSLHKHIAFGLFFVAPLAGVAVARASGYRHGRTIGRRWLAGFAIGLLVFVVGYRQAQQFYAEWPNSDELVRLLRAEIRPDGGRILAEESEVPRYYLQDMVVAQRWSHLYWFAYADEDGRELLGNDAYEAAIEDGYFEWVVLRYGPCAATAYAIDAGLKRGDRYTQVARIPYVTTFGEGAYWIWRRR